MKKNQFYCTACGARYPKWLGRCEDCGQWNSIVEEVEERGGTVGTARVDFVGLSLSGEKVARRLCNFSEFDRVIGGGAVPGSVILIGGDPGIGKSTLLLQVLSKFSENYNCVYISGEESAEQIQLRATRLKVNEANIRLACDNNVDAIIKSLDSKVDFLVIDSIQTLQSPLIESVPGTVSQVRACACELINFAKTSGTTVFLVGHVTKDGMLAGPKILEHMVDTVLYFEGERGDSYRILRSVKNRYGSCDEIGIFEMKQNGLSCVSNPSAFFLTPRSENTPGTTVFAGIEGTRPILVEVQALVTKSYFTMPRRNVIGWDLNRLFMIMAVLESKCKMSFSDRDVYLSIAGGLKISEPACDLAVAISLLSARNNRIVDMKTCVFGEIGLTGEVRSVSRYNERLKEAEKLGFKNVLLPRINDSIMGNYPGLELNEVRSVSDLSARLGVIS